MIAIQLAKEFHEIYEDEAISNNWNTQQKCKVKFEDLPLENKITMIQTCEKLLEKYNIVERINSFNK